MKRKLTAAIASMSLPIFVQDSSSATGGGLGSLAFNTSGLVAEYRREGQSSWTAITLVAGTLGTWSSGGFVADGALAGAYEFGVPNAVLAAGVRWAAIRLRGAANMVPVLIEIEVDAVNYQDAAAFGMSRLDAAISTRSTYAGGAVASVTAPVTLPAAPTDWISATAVSAAAVTKVQSGLATPTNITAGTITTVTNLTNAPTSGDFTAAMKASLDASTPNASATLGADAFDSIIVEAADGSQPELNARQALSLLVCAAPAGLIHGANTASITVQNPAGTHNRVVATVDSSGNRTNVVLTPPA